MEITIQSVNFETSESLNAYITKKLGKMNRFTEIRVAEVQLKILNTTEKSNREVGVKLLRQFLYRSLFAFEIQLTNGRTTAYHRHYGLPQ